MKMISNRTNKITTLGILRWQCNYTNSFSLFKPTSEYSNILSALLLIKLGWRDVAWIWDQVEPLFPTPIPDIGEEVGSARAYSHLLPLGGDRLSFCSVAGRITFQSKVSLLEVKVPHRSMRRRGELALLQGR